ncbi:MAG: radical SAM family heme chaperone HemW [Clostridia bacterium]|nr:radical SAM family heme chaperone HemW [Clostridia bacterium]
MTPDTYLTALPRGWAQHDGTLGLYLHIPFCVQKCRYCDFYSAPADDAARAAYVAALAAHLRAAAPAARDRVIDTVYFGGGTPTLLTGAQFATVMDTVRAHYDLAPDAEITAECNPVTNAEHPAEGLLAAGINRLSIGLQSANENELRLLGRLHDYRAFARTFAAARRAGFSNISVDLMLGIPDQTRESLSHTLDAVLALAPEHISAYGLRIEEHTPFFAMRDRLVLPDEDTEELLFDDLVQRLGGAGYAHYEISNFARAGYASRHNLRYWQGREYLGFGPGAHSYFHGTRFETPKSTADYISAANGGDFPATVADPHPITGREAAAEYVMLRMRLFEGLDSADFAHRFGTSFESTYGPLDRLLAGGFLTKHGTRFAFTERGMRVSNAILSDWLDFGTDEEEL